MIVTQDQQTLIGLLQLYIIYMEFYVTKNMMSHSQSVRIYEVAVVG